MLSSKYLCSVHSIRRMNRAMRTMFALLVGTGDIDYLIAALMLCGAVQYAISQCDNYGRYAEYVQRLVKGFCDISLAHSVVTTHNPS